MAKKLQGRMKHEAHIAELCLEGILSIQAGDNPRIVERLRQVNAQHGFDRDMKIEIESFPPGVRLRQRPGRFEP